MTFSQPLKLLAIGGGLITTNTLWFFGDDEKGDAKEIDENINAYDSSPKLTNGTRKSIVDSNFKKVSKESLGIKFTYGNLNTNKILRSDAQGPEIDDLEIKGDYYATTRKQYREFDRSWIKIQLFDKPVGHDDTSKEELYKDPLNKDQMDQLFKDHDETNIKQLLYSLQQKRIGIHNGTDTSSNIIYYQPSVHYQFKKIDELKELKIRYFSDFDRFKDYVHTKVKSCTDPKKACIAHLDELDIMDFDQKSIFNL